jgi:transcriptional regulator with XRE-family HTH domain
MNDVEKSDLIRFSQNLNDFLLKKKLSIHELSRLMDVPVSTIHGWLNGAEPKRIKDLKKVSSFLGLTIDELCFGNDSNEPAPEILITVKKNTFRIHLSKIDE